MRIRLTSTSDPGADDTNSPHREVSFYKRVPNVISCPCGDSIRYSGSSGFAQTLPARNHIEHSNHGCTPSTCVYCPHSEHRPIPSTCVLPAISAIRPTSDRCSACASLVKHVRQNTLPGLSCKYRISMADSFDISHERSTCLWFH